MITLDSKLLAIGGAQSGISPANLLEVEDVNGNMMYWADRKISATSVMTQSVVTFLPWLISVPSFTFNRSLTTDTGSFRLQNLSGNTLARDFESQLRASAIDGAMFVYRLWQPGAEAAWLEIHGTLSLEDLGPDAATLRAAQMFNMAAADLPMNAFSETCQLNWGGTRCGSTQTTECNYSFQSCQVVERCMVALNDYEKNWGETSSNTPLTVINRRRRY